ncbi:hypoxanthine phosphoribosyltransferase [Abyssicoccus albus]|uniref:hypoxanthine phosphoribosyltransferase n=1 Tax=Abyssicoccus albus TaxID=1817405 RepID=UPI00097E22C6|nr:hypoxanthine phosphoribosyltransferase [Abyssicoccus albus]AQL56931.1 hypoxanthine phosphoribosyltransferase [Abyssicoccus albus]
MKNLDQDIKSVVVSKERIEEICQTLGERITKDYRDKDLICIGLLKGCSFFMTDLLKYVDTHLEIEYMDVSSYHGSTESTGEVKINLDLSRSVEGKDLLIVEDIVETGTTLNSIIDLLTYRKAKSIEIVTLLDKPNRRKIPMTPKYIGETIPDEFVVGYGLDYNENYRNMDYIGLLKEEVYKKS